MNLFGEDQRRYSPATIIKIKHEYGCGDPDPERVSTSLVERSNLTLRMTLRRWTRLTNAHSKSLRHHEAAICLYLAFYNFCRPHMTLKNRTPAQATGLTDHRWTIEELLTQAAA